MSDYMDYAELALRCCGLTEDEANETLENFDDVEQKIYDKFEVDSDTFEKIARALVKFTPVLESPLFKTRHHTFGIQEDIHFTAIVKEQV